MPISERARRNHDELFPGHVSTLAVTDPELIEVFDNFAFDEVQSHGVIDARTRLLTQLAAMIASQAVAEFRVMVGAALTVGVTPVEVKEVVYQAVPYIGMAKVFDVLHATNEVFTDRGIELPLPGQSTTTPEDRMDVGLATQKQVVGADAVDVRPEPRGRAAHPALPVRQLLRRPRRTRGPRPRDARAADLRDAGGARRV